MRCDAILTVIGYMNHTTYNKDTQVVSIQPGARWGSVYEALNQYNVTVVGARTSVVGVGGFTTGGGVSLRLLDVESNLTAAVYFSQQLARIGM